MLEMRMVFGRHNAPKLKMAAGLVGMFVLGGVTGAFGFKHVGFVCVVPLAALLWALSLPPFLRDISRLKGAMRSAYCQFDKH